MAGRRTPFQYQYMGVTGDTLACLQALVTVLTSPYRCNEMTVVFQEREPSERTTGVCFVAWDWMGSEVTIISDGFGTHSGTGGWGLKVALELVAFHRIDLHECWMPRDGFERIVAGRLREADKSKLRETTSWGSVWERYQGDFGPTVWSEALVHADLPMRFDMVLPELLYDVRGFDTNPNDAVLSAVRRLETALRDMGNLNAGDVGQRLVNQAMGDDGSLRPKGATEDEKVGWANLYRGIIGAIKNPLSHRDVPIDHTTAIEQILLTDLLLRKLKLDYPEQFGQWSKSVLSRIVTRRPLMDDFDRC